MNPARKVKLPRPKKSKTNNALKKHKAWLATMAQKQQATRNNEFTRQQEEQLKETRLRNKMEKTYKKINGHEDVEEKEYDLNKDEDVENLIQKLENEPGAGPVKTPNSAVPPPSKPQSKKGVPAWAKTE